MALKLGILISGRGSNMEAIMRSIRSGKLNAEIAVVISNRSDAGGLVTARNNNIPVSVILPKEFRSQAEYETRLVEELQAKNIDLIVLAGYMKIAGPVLLASYKNKIMNIHPSLLPSFKGLHAQKQALDAGVKYAGCTVHFVNETLDGGPIILQEVVPVLSGDTEDTLSARILEKEHIIYSKAIQLYSENKLIIDHNKTEILN